MDVKKAVSYLWAMVAGAEDRDINCERQRAAISFLHDEIESLWVTAEGLRAQLAEANARAERLEDRTVRLEVALRSARRMCAEGNASATYLAELDQALSPDPQEPEEQP